jgi:hypothetical protein
LPPVLRGRLGSRAAAHWDALELPVKREIIRTVADIRVEPIGAGQIVPVADRVRWRWLLVDPDGNPA